MNLGAFSISLPVADLAASLEFYERLGFEVTGGEADEGWLVLRNGLTTIGLFHGMFDEPMLTFNPGLLQTKEPTTDFTDVRDIQTVLVDGGVELTQTVEPDGTGPGHLMLEDPDGHRILIDQFFDHPDVPRTD